MKEIQIGDIFRMSWGYDQTNVDYFQVVRLTERCVVVREIKSEEVPGTNKGGMACQVRPVKDAFSAQSQWVKDNSVGIARKTGWYNDTPHISFGKRYFAYRVNPLESAFCSWYA